MILLCAFTGFSTLLIILVQFKKIHFTVYFFSNLHMLKILSRTVSHDE